MNRRRLYLVAVGLPLNNQKCSSFHIKNMHCNYLNLIYWFKPAVNNLEGVVSGAITWGSS